MPIDQKRVQTSPASKILNRNDLEFEARKLRALSAGSLLTGLHHHHDLLLAR